MRRTLPANLEPPRLSLASGSRGARLARSWRAGAALAALCLLLHLPGLFSLPPVDRDESRFAQASRQMSEGDALRDWVVPMVQNRPRLNKPPLIYWLQAACASLLGDDPPGPAPEGYVRELQSGSLAPETGSIGVYRLPSALCATLAALVTWRLGSRMFDPRAALLGGVLLGSCVMVVWDAHQARADQLLLLTTVLTQWALWRMWREREPRASAGLAALFWLFLALGVMAKGPITPLVAALTALALSLATRNWRWLRSLRPLLGVAIVLGVVGPWVVAVGQCVGWSDYLSLIYDETIGRGLSARESHWGPPGYHLVLLPLMLWPGSLATAIGVHRAVRLGWPRKLGESWRRRRAGRDAELFCLAWAAPAWIVFELASTKLPHYTLPLYPALALLSARAVLAIGASGSPSCWIARQARTIGSRTGFVLWGAIGLCVCVALPAFVVWWGGFAPDTTARVAFGACLAGGLAACLYAMLAAVRMRLARAQVVGVVAAALAVCTVFAATLPHVPSLWVSSRLANALRALDPAGSRPLASVGYAEDSLVYLTRGRSQRLARDAARAWLDANPGGLLVVPNSEDLTALRARPAGRTRGFNYSTGRWVHLLIVEALPVDR